MTKLDNWHFALTVVALVFALGITKDRWQPHLDAWRNKI